MNSNKVDEEISTQKFKKNKDGEEIFTGQKFKKKSSKTNITVLKFDIFFQTHTETLRRVIFISTYNGEICATMGKKNPILKPKWGDVNI